MTRPQPITASGLTKTFGPHRAVEDVSFAVEAGEVFGFLGPNGAGKSTTLRLLLGLLRPTGGSASILGLDVWRDRTAIHTQVGTLPSDFAFEPAQTGRQLLTLFDRLRNIDSNARQIELAERLHADLDRPLRELSRGNHQKIGLIQAMAHQPRILILDEPTTGLDPLMQEEFLRLLDEVRHQDCTVLLSSHNMAEAQRACDRVGMIHQGRLRGVHSVEHLLRQARRRLRITFDRAADAKPFKDLTGVEVIRVTGNVVEIELEGEPDPALRQAIAFGVVKDVETSRPSLEDVFVQMYSDGKNR